MCESTFQVTSVICRGFLAYPHIPAGTVRAIITHDTDRAAKVSNQLQMDHIYAGILYMMTRDLKSLPAYGSEKVKGVEARFEALLEGGAKLPTVALSESVRPTLGSLIDEGEMKTLS